MVIREGSVVEFGLGGEKGNLLILVLDCPDARDVTLGDGGLGCGLDEGNFWGGSAVGVEGGNDYFDFLFS